MRAGDTETKFVYVYTETKSVYVYTETKNGSNYIYIIVTPENLYMSIPNKKLH